MRVAIIAPPWVPVPPPAYGGTEAVLDNLARGLQTDGHDVLLFTTGDSTCDVPMQSVHPRAVGTLVNGVACELSHVLHSYSFLSDWEPDVVHDHTLIGPMHALRLDVPVVTTNHGPFDGDLRDYYAMIADSVPIVALSRHHADTAFPIPVAGVIPHGVDLDAFPMGDGSGDYALFLGRMTREKGAAVAARVARSAGVPLLIAAKMREPAERRYFDEEVAPLLGDSIEYLGEVSEEKKLALLSGARCLLNPLAWPEPFGMVMIEALACGTPVVATPCGSVPELVTDGETGFVCADEAELERGVSESGDISRERCRADVVERFSSARMVADHVALYERVAQRRPHVVA